MQETYKVNENYDDTNIADYISYNQCLNNPIAVMKINMQNATNNITELFDAWGETNEMESLNEGFGILVAFAFKSDKFEVTTDHYHIKRKKDSTNCITIHSDAPYPFYNMIFTYYIDEMDWEEGTTITELNINIATNIAYCLNHNTVNDVNTNILKQGYYFVAKDNMVEVYSTCNNECGTDLTIQYDYDVFTGAPNIVNETSFTEINNESDNSMYVNYYSTDTGYVKAPLINPYTPKPAYTLVEYQYILDVLIGEMTAYLKFLYPIPLKDLDAVAYTKLGQIERDGKQIQVLYVTIDSDLSYFPIWLSGDGITVIPVYTNAYIQDLPADEVIENWGYYGENVLQITNYS